MIELEPKSGRLDLPPTTELCEECLVLALRLPNLLELKITPAGMSMTRSVLEDDPVPQTLRDIARGIVPGDPDFEFLVGNLEILDLGGPIPMGHPLKDVMAMFQAVTSRDLLASRFFVSRGDGLAAYLGLEPHEMPPSCFGVPVSYLAEEAFPEGKLLLVAGPSRHLVDSTFGVLVEMGQ